MPVYKVNIIHYDRFDRIVKFKGLKEGVTPTSLEKYVTTSLTNEKAIKKLLVKNEAKLVDTAFCPWRCEGKHTFLITKVDPGKVPKGNEIIPI